MSYSRKRVLLECVQRASLTGAGWIIRLAYRFLFRGKNKDFIARGINLSCSMPGWSRNCWSVTAEDEKRIKAESKEIKRMMREAGRPVDYPAGSAKSLEILHARQYSGDCGGKLSVPRAEDIWQLPS